MLVMPMYYLIKSLKEMMVHVNGLTYIKEPKWEKPTEILHVFVKMLERDGVSWEIT